MKVIERAEMPDGTYIQLEDWKENYPTVFTALSIGAYPTAKRTGKYKLIKQDDIFRISINRYKTDSEVLEDFEALKSGQKCIEDLATRFWNLEKDMWYLGMDVVYRGY